jgi:hypothetical protein
MRGDVMTSEAGGPGRRAALHFTRLGKGATKAPRAVQDHECAAQPSEASSFNRKPLMRMLLHAMIALGLTFKLRSIDG